MCSLQAKATATSKSHYRGVRKKSEGRFFAVINDPSQRRRKWLGTFSSDIEAAHAYDRAAIAIKGCKAKTNFPLSAYQIPKPVQRSAASKNPEPLKQVHVPSLISTNMVAKAATRPILPKPTMWAVFPPELRRQQQLAAFKMSYQPRCNENEDEGGVEQIHKGCQTSYRPCNSSDPSSSAVTECRASPTMGGLDLNLPPPVEEDECHHSPKTLWLLK
ncbi:hypothetical protein SUGI_1176300 [Cryptomeria japonica]|uniref:ethylene-responsive transcription factor 3-like n=1 Tax=Cryptomeria japonica TaxID=3369 RepID=UPI0024148E8D|nr:ethylene-responsive transcription factor 3-like [Cryptomeria japonica]GLJ54762.1 hypothetical protein SUGI_1176300 [Cryptomeria japonica]